MAMAVTRAVQGAMAAVLDRVEGMLASSAKMHSGGLVDQLGLVVAVVPVFIVAPLAQLVGRLLAVVAVEAQLAGRVASQLSGRLLNKLAGGCCCTPGHVLDTPVTPVASCFVSCFVKLFCQ